MLLTHPDKHGVFRLTGPAPLQFKQQVACGDLGCVYNHLDWSLSSGAAISGCGTNESTCDVRVGTGYGWSGVMVRQSNNPPLIYLLWNSGKPGGTISGYVTDLDHVGVPGASVTASGPGGGTSPVQGGSGFYSIKLTLGTVPGPFELSAWAGRIAPPPDRQSRDRTRHRRNKPGERPAWTLRARSSMSAPGVQRALPSQLSDEQEIREIKELRHLAKRSRISRSSAISSAIRRLNDSSLRRSVMRAARASRTNSFTDTPSARAATSASRASKGSIRRVRTFRSFMPSRYQTAKMAHYSRQCRERPWRAKSQIRDVASPSSPTSWKDPTADSLPRRLVWCDHW